MAKYLSLLPVIFVLQSSMTAAWAADPLRLSIWPEQAPLGEGKYEKVEVPITIHLPDPAKATGVAVVICPGGGYGGLVVNGEGHGIAKWLNTHGIAGIVLEYRLPKGNYHRPMLDAQRAVRVVRSRAAEWKIDPQRIGIIGFSAGGHLASTVGTHFDAGNAASTDPVERVSCRPDFMLLVYPVITMGEKTHGGSRQNLLGNAPTAELKDLFSNDKQVTKQTPPTFLTHAKTDSVVPVEHSRMFYAALQQQGVPAELQEFPEGNHGYNGYKGKEWDAWQKRSLEWLRERGILKAGTVRAADWYVAANGVASAKGTKESPWDITSALGGRHKLAPGDTLWIGGGLYKFPPKVVGQGFPVTLAGTEQAPIHIRPMADQRVRVDGGLVLNSPASYLWIWDLEIFVSEPKPAKPLPPDPTYQNVNRPWGGLNVNSGAGCKFINLVIHDNSQGVSWWVGSTDSELHGCLIYNNGWPGTDRGHGHAIYTQNREGTKTISDCIMTGGFGFTMHAYGSSRASVDNYVVERNIFYNAGRFLIGGGRPSANIQVYSNCLYNLNMQLGYTAPTNHDCIVQDNVILNGTLEINKFQHAVVTNNTVITPKSVRPTRSRIFLFPNKYDRRRANLAIFNWDKKAEVEMELGSFLRTGEKFRLMDPRDFFGRPVLSGTYEPGGFKLAMPGEFGAWVLVKD